jgi:hypothetical protein
LLFFVFSYQCVQYVLSICWCQVFVTGQQFALFVRIDICIQCEYVVVVDALWQSWILPPRGDCWKRDMHASIYLSAVC